MTVARNWKVLEQALDEFVESEHPRAPDGKFGDGSSASPMSHAEAKKNYEKDVIPKGWFTHGRSTVDAGKEDVLQTGNPIFMTKNNDIAEGYAKNGSVHYLAPGVETDVHDLVNDPEGFSRIEKAFKRDFERGILPSEFDEVLEREGISDDPEAAWEVVKEDFDPQDLVQSGGWYDTNVVSWLSDNFPQAFFNLTGGAVALSPDTLQRHQVRDGKHQARDHALSPNAAIPAGLRRKTAFDASGITKHAAGVLFVAPDGDILLLRRTGTPGKDNFVGHWSLPGGGVEEGETPEIGAAREAKEEMGVDTDPKSFKVLDQKVTPTGMAFHTFAQPVEKKFWPTLNDEHNGAGWFPLSELPQPIHPAVEAMLKDKLGDDLGGARDGLIAWSKAPFESDAEDDLSDFVGDASFSETDHPRAPDGKFGSGGGSTGPNHHVIHEKGDPRPKASENEARMLGLSKTKPDDRSAHASKKPVSHEALTAKLKGMSTAKLHAAAENKDVDPLIRAHVKREITSRLMAGDSVFLIAMDRDSVRSFDRDGRMRVAIANLSKEQIRPYVGREIPGWDDATQTHKLGLDPDKIYNLYCPGEELEKAAETFNGIQLLKKHTPVNAEDHKKNDIIGTTGTNAKFNSPFLQNSLVVWTQEGIDLIESEEMKELSCGYFYVPLMTPGVFKGEPFDGIMTQLSGNHLTIVGDGRAGSECQVEDSAVELQWAAIERAMMDMAT
jgi:ADP-ribose pyrophosphatase YjhB (NUDIX family)